MDNEKNEVLQDVSFVLISDFLAYILESDVAVPTLAHQDLQNKIGSYWANETNTHIAQWIDAIPDFATAIPFFHENGVPHWHHLALQRVHG